MAVRRPLKHVRMFGKVLLVWTMIATSVLVASAAPASAATGSIAGNVFRDFDLNGTQDDGVDFGEAGIEVRVYDDEGNVTPPVTSSSTGDYSVDLGPLTETLDGTYRVEFSIPADMGYLRESFLGATNGSSVQFAAAGATGVDFAVTNPAQFCDSNPHLAVTCWTNGQADGDSNDGQWDADLTDALVTIPWDAYATGPTSQVPDRPSFVATNGDIGTTWGLAYQRSTDTLFTSAVQRRHTGFVNGQTGAIYRANPDGTGRSLFLDVNAIPGISTGADPHTGLPDVSWNPANPASIASADPASFDAVGKISLGDLDISEDDQTLWSVNLNDRTLIEIAIGDATATPTSADITVHSIAASAPACSNGVFRPFGLSIRDGLVYVGGVCSGENGGSVADVYAHVLTHDPTGADGNLTPFYSMPMDYRTALRPASECTVGADFGGTACSWTEWSSSWAPTGPNGPNLWSDPQPMLTDIEIDADGSLVLSFADRWGLQAGFNNYDPAGSGALYNGATGGDLVRVCNIDGSLTFPCNADNSEFYVADVAPDQNFIPLEIHPESAWGGSAMMFRDGEVAFTMADPTNFWSGGLGWADASSGEINPVPGGTRRYQVFEGYNQDNTSSPDISGIGKATGLGDLELICEAAPFEIGDRVWFDRNRNGVQDGSEPAIPGVTVELRSSDGLTLLGTTTTNENGQYVFDSLTHGLELDADYELHFDATTADVSNVANVGDARTLEPTVQNASAATSSSDSNIDSSGVARIRTGATVGSTDHSFDAGFHGSLQLGNLVWLDVNEDGDASPGEPLVAGLLLQLFKESGDAPGFDAEDVLVDSTITDSTGTYLFSNLEDGAEYYVAAPNDQGAAIASIDGDVVDVTALMPTLGTGSGPDNGNDGAASPGFLSATNGTIVSDDAEPTNEVDTPFIPARDAGQFLTGELDLFIEDEDSNLTVDLGIIPKVRVGNLVWFDQGASDNTNDGLAQADEPGLVGVALELWSDVDDDGVFEPAGDDSTGFVSATTTDDEGNYAFSLLAEGPYFLAIPEAETVDNSADNADVLANVRPSSGVSRNAQADDNADDEAADTAEGYVSVSTVVSLSTHELRTGETDANTDATPDAEFEADTAGPAHLDSSSDLGVDFGFVERLRLGGIVWHDEGADDATSDDGIVTIDEVGLAGVLVQLLAIDGTVIAETVTDDQGAYWFDGLDEGDYQVGIPSNQSGATDLGGNAQAISGFTSSLGTNGAGSISANPETGDNDDDGDPQAGFVSRTATITLANGSEPTGETDSNIAPGRDAEAHVEAAGSPNLDDRSSNMHIDLGLIATPTLSVGNRVWADWNDSGMQDDGEPGIGDVVVELWLASTDRSDPLAVPVDTTTTNDDGYYFFDDIVAEGDYVVVIPASNSADATDPLNGWFVSSVVDPADDDVDQKNAGVLDEQTGDVVSGSFELMFDSEPTNEPDTPASVRNFDAPYDNHANATVDFGFTTLSVGNLVWFDSNANGVQDDGEPAIADVSVELWTAEPGSNPELLATMSTDAQGTYLFTGVERGKVVVVIAATNFEAGEPLEGLKPVVENSPDAPTIDDDNDGALAEGAVRSPTQMLMAGGLPVTNDADNGATPGSSGLVLPDANEDLSIDFGFHGLSVGNRVFIDDDGDGAMRPGELGRADVLVELWAVTETGAAALLDSTNTDQDGFYLFTGVTPGNVFVRIPAGNFEPGNALFGHTSTVGNGLFAPDVDADPTDGDDNGNPVLVGATESSIVTLVANSEPTGETDLGGQINTSDDPNSNLTVDFGFVVRPGLSLGNRVFEDTNGNHLHDDGEPGIDGVTVELIDADGTVIGTDITSGDGYYLFPLVANNGDLLEGDYVVRIPASNFDEPTDALWGKWSSTDDPAMHVLDPDENDADRDDNGLDPDVAFGDVVSESITLTDSLEPLGETDVEGAPDPDNDQNQNLTVDFGFTMLALGDLVFADHNNDSVRSADEPGIADVPLALLGSDGSPVRDGAGIPMTTTTNSDGNYLFEGLAEGEYIVEIPASAFTDPASALFGRFSSTDTVAGGIDPESEEGAGVDDDDNGIDPVTAGSAVWSLPVNLGPDDSPSETTLDFGFSAGTIGNLVFEDLDDDGVFTDGVDEPVPGVVVNLLDADGVAVSETATTTTDERGNYVLAVPGPGTFIVEIADSNFAMGGPLEAMASSDANDVDGVTPDPDAENPIDFDDNGIPTGATPFIGDAVWSAPVTILPGTEPTGEDQSGALVGVPDSSQNQAVDFGFFEVPFLELGNKVFLDVDNSGDFGPADEAGPAGVIVNLLDADGQPVVDSAGEAVSVVTNDAGEYAFSTLPPGDYVVELDVANFVADGPLAGLWASTGAATSTDPEDSTDSNSDGVQGADGVGVRSGVVTLSFDSEPVGEDDASPTELDSGYSNLTVDFGVYASEVEVQVALPPEVQLPVDVALTNHDCTALVGSDGEALMGQIDADSTMTVIGGVPDGTVHAAVPASSLDDGGPLDGLVVASQDLADMHVNGCIVSEPIEVLASDVLGAVVQAPALQLAEAGTIGDRVWLDENRNGIQDTSEVGVENVTLRLFDSTGSIVATTTTRADGSYEFVDVVPGSYIVELDLPSGRTLATSGVGANRMVDSDFDPTTRRVSIIISSGDAVTNIDAGLQSPTSVPPVIAFTGREAIPTVVLGLLLLLLGAAFLAVGGSSGGWRRRAQDTLFGHTVRR